MDHAVTIYQPLDYTDLTEQTYRLLKDKILKYELQPGAKVSVSEIAAALGVSRTPVMDALKRLASDGLVEIMARRGTFVADLTAQDVAEIFEMRLMIECYAAAQIFRSGRVALFLAQAQAPMHAMEQTITGDEFSDYDTFTANDQVFHSTLVALTENSRILRTYTQLHTHTQGARIYHLNGGSALRTQAEHQAIIAAFQGHDAQQACQALEAHILAVQSHILGRLSQRGGKL